MKSGSPARRTSTAPSSRTSPYARTNWGCYYEADVAFEPDSASARYKVRAMEAVLGLARDATEARGVPLLVVAVPHLVDATTFHVLGRMLSSQFFAYRREALTGHVARIAADLGVPCVDLLGPFRMRGSKPLYLGGGDPHWSERGQEVASEVVAERIIEEGLVRPR